MSPSTHWDCRGRTNPFFTLVRKARSAFRDDERALRALEPPRVSSVASGDLRAPLSRKNVGKNDRPDASRRWRSASASFEKRRSAPLFVMTRERLALSRTKPLGRSAPSRMLVASRPLHSSGPPPTTGRPLRLNARPRYLGVRQGGRVWPYAAACRAAIRRFKSGPWLGEVERSETPSVPSGERSDLRGPSSRVRRAANAIADSNS